MCGRCGKALFLPRRVVVKKPPVLHRLIALLVEFGGRVLFFASAEDVLQLLVVNRAAYSALTSDRMQHFFWKALVLEHFSRRFPLVFPSDKGPEADDDICQLLPGLECPEHNCWLAYFRLATLKCRWLAKTRSNALFVQFQLAQLQTEDYRNQQVEHHSAVFSRNTVFFLFVQVFGKPPAFSYQAIEDLLWARRSGQRPVILTSRIAIESALLPAKGDDNDNDIDSNDNGSNVDGRQAGQAETNQLGQPLVIAWLKIEPLPDQGSGISHGDVVSALKFMFNSSRGTKEESGLLSDSLYQWACNPLPAQYEMPLECYLLYRKVVS
jgi:hypothetical protein